MTKTLKRIRTLLTAAPTWLAGAGIVVAAVSEEIVKVLPDNLDAGVTRVAVVALAVIVAAQQIVRRVTPVFGTDRGLLPLNERNQHDA